MTGPDEKLAQVCLRTAVDALAVAYQACMAADFGNVHVLGPLERIQSDLREVVKAVLDGTPGVTAVAPAHPFNELVSVEKGLLLHAAALLSERAPCASTECRVSDSNDEVMKCYDKLLAATGLSKASDGVAAVQAPSREHIERMVDNLQRAISEGNATRLRLAREALLSLADGVSVPDHQTVKP